MRRKLHLVRATAEAIGKDRARGNLAPSRQHNITRRLESPLDEMQTADIAVLPDNRCDSSDAMISHRLERSLRTRRYDPGLAGFVFMNNHSNFLTPAETSSANPALSWQHLPEILRNEFPGASREISQALSPSRRRKAPAPNKSYSPSHEKP
jgi:hypothetical protein